MKKFDLLEIIRKGTLEPIGNFFKLMNENGKHIATFQFEEDRGRNSVDIAHGNLPVSENNGTMSSI